MVLVTTTTRRTDRHTGWSGKETGTMSTFVITFIVSFIKAMRRNRRVAR